MTEYIVWLRHRSQATLKSVRVQAESYYEASCLSRWQNPGYTVSRVYLFVNHEDD